MPAPRQWRVHECLVDFGPLRLDELCAILESTEGEVLAVLRRMVDVVEGDDGWRALADREDESGVVVELGVKQAWPVNDLGRNEWCVVAYGKYGNEVERVFPITAATGDREAVDAFRRRAFAQFGGDSGKYFTRVMPSRDFLCDRPPRAG